MKLRSAIRRSLRAQGFRIAGNRVSFRQRRDKRSIRKRHEHAVDKRIALAESALAKHETELLAFIASGGEVDPQSIKPRLLQVEPDTFESKLFRYACLHWSIPISDGYGRRLRFLIFDDSNGKLVGVFGLGDPVYAIKARDEWIGWGSEAKAARLYHVMDAYVLGAVPPYSRLLAGKLVALAATCSQVRRAFAKRYGNRASLISRRKREPHLVLITTTSALGRSSLYNRVKVGKRLVFESVGFTGGWGEFHFSDGVYEDISEFARKRCVPTAKQAKWGNGFRNRRELVRKALAKLGFTQDMLNHGIQREVFVAPLASNAREFLRGEHPRPRYHRLSFARAVKYWRERWLLPRAERDASFREFDSAEWRLWKERNDD
ncbi:MAG: DUF4338 domain-containing protein [Verrucomicrobiae bacterium]|nr:DUF4338 domain-containing protein [Verrucomicrobiae bacterium]